MQSKIVYVLGFLFLSSCATTPAPSPKTPPSSGEVSWSNEDFMETQKKMAQLLNHSKSEKFVDTLGLNVFYVTNRAFTPGKGPCSNDSFGITPGGDVQYGVCRVNVPKKHATGKIEAAVDDSADAEKFFKVLSSKSYDFDPFLKAIQRAGSSQVLVFVHGFNVKFQEAVLRAAQLAYDLKFQGPVVLFSWPAGAEDGILSSTLIAKTYKINRANAQQSIKDAVDFFDLVSHLNMKTYLYVHSMGHQVVIPALMDVAKDTDVNLLVNEMVFNAPDFDLKQFKELAPSLRKLANRITLYCSYNDTAMSASEQVNGGTRLGACEAVPGIDVINVSEIDNPTFGLGHGYYSSRAVLTDVAQLMMGLDVENRLFIRKSENQSKENYFLRP